MTNHYYSQKPEVKHDEKIIKAKFHDKEFTFKTDSGVFSKTRVDYGTSLLIEAFQMPEQAKILDLGCGYGPVGIVIASRLTRGEVLLVDINERAVGLADNNISSNHNLFNDNVNISAKQSSGFAKVSQKDFDYILLNPPIRAGKSLIYQLFEEAYDHLNDTGELWIVIQKKQGAPSTITKMKSIFSQVEEVERSKGYFIIKSIK